MTLRFAMRKPGTTAQLAVSIGMPANNTSPTAIARITNELEKANDKLIADE